MKIIKQYSPQRRGGAKKILSYCLASLRLSGKNYLIVLLFSLLALQSCSRKEESVPKEIISPDSMVAIMVDVHLAEASGNVNRINDMQRFSAGELYPLIFRTHHIDSATFRKSFDYYLEHPEQFNKIYEKVLNELSRMESEPNIK